MADHALMINQAESASTNPIEKMIREKVQVNDDPAKRMLIKKELIVVNLVQVLAASPI